MIMGLFETNLTPNAPLSVRMRPSTLEECVGQEHILGPGKLLTRAVEADRVTSIILYGPPGSGKTTMALCISKKTNANFESVNAVASNVEELRKIIASAKNRLANSGSKTILFIDEIHRFNKAQQDVLMPDVENGNLVLIGATTMNPFFSLVTPLLSRSLVFELRPLTEENILTLLERSLKDKENGLGKIKIKVDKKALKFLAEISDGDARRALNALEVGCLTTPKNKEGAVVFSIEVAQESIQKKQVQYDGDGDVHYDTASAFIKSMRGSDPDAALYWMAKMIYAGEDPRFIARRICICAAEDVGNADPNALLVASAALEVSEFVGLPEARIPLAQAAVYVACAPKSNAVYLGIDKALEDVKTKKAGNVPSHLRDGSYSGAKQLGHGQGYKYAHDFPEHYVPNENYWPDNMKKIQFYKPSNQGMEQRIVDRLKFLRELDRINNANK
jgi:putative ATPase